jgi:hypothetical protein
MLDLLIPLYRELRVGELDMIRGIADMLKVAFVVREQSRKSPQYLDVLSPCGYQNLIANLVLISQVSFG